MVEGDEGMSDALEMAVFFHETYERLAPSFGYATREDTKQFDPSSNNGRLMQAVCAAWIEQRDARIRELEVENRRLYGLAMHVVFCSDGSLLVEELQRSARTFVQERDSSRARIRELEQWKQAVIDGLVAAEIYRDAHESDPKAALKDLIQWRGLFKEGLNAMIMVRVLESKIAAHEKACPGVWVDVKERTPEEHRWFPGLYPGGFIVDTQFREGEYYRYGDAEPTTAITHWLDAKQPDGGVN